MNYFEYNGVRSCDLGLRIESKDVFSAPAYDADFKSIPGRDGDLILPNGRFANVQVTYSVFLPAKSPADLAFKLTAVKAWLFSQPDRYHQLTDTYDTSFSRKAVYKGKLDIEDQLSRIGLFTVSFSCLPFRYSTEGQQETTVTVSGTTLTNPYPFRSKPYLRINGSGKITLTIQSADHNRTWNFSGVDQYIEVDSELMNFFKDTEPQNDRVSGDGFPTFDPGENTISFTGKVTSVDVKPRWCSL